MNKTVFKILAFIFGLMAFGGLMELFRIMTSDAADIASQRTHLTIVAGVILVVMLTLTNYFWRKRK